MAHGDRKEKSGKNSVGGEGESGTRNTNKSSSNEEAATAEMSSMDSLAPLYGKMSAGFTLFSWSPAESALNMS